MENELWICSPCFFMKLPFFYIERYDPSSSLIALNEETSKHAVQVLRMKQGEQLNLTDGKGNLLTAQITDADKRNCIVKVLSTVYNASSMKKVCVAISLVKNASRFEWFLEKAAEIGVSEIIPLICERTERQHFRYERMKGIMVSAMLQSQQTWLPVLQEPKQFADLVIWKMDDAKKMIAHCNESDKQSITEYTVSGVEKFQILIGPEGDFTPTEIQLAIDNHFQPVALGDTRLRTETAGMVAATLLSIS